jgi:hypothetical protein
METIFIGVVIVGATCLLSYVGLVATRRTCKPSVLQKHHDVAGFILSIIGVIYGVLQAFVVFVVWSHYEDARTAADTEANDVGDLFRMAHGFPSGVQVQIRSDLRDYTHAVSGDEWGAMQRRQSSKSAEHALDLLWTTYETIEPRTNSETALFQESIARLEDVSDSRRARIAACQWQIPPLMWFVLLFSGIATIVFTYFFGAENFRAQATMTVLLASQIAVVLYLIAALATPFGGTMGITPELFAETNSKFVRIETHELERRPKPFSKEEIDEARREFPDRRSLR